MTDNDKNGVPKPEPVPEGVTYQIIFKNKPRFPATIGVLLVAAVFFMLGYFLGAKWGW